MTDETKPCTCATPEEAVAKGCRRAGLPMVGRLYDLCACRGDVHPRMSEAYRRLWDGMPQLDTPNRSKPCFYKGEATGELRQCGSCQGNVREKIFQCKHPGHALNPTTTVRACEQCADWRQDDPFALSPRSVL
jgi:hypothetical protein